MDWWKKVVVMAGGPSVNIAIAFFIFWGVFALYGNPNDSVPLSGQPVISTVSDCVIPVKENRSVCTADDPISPAAAAGLKRGDVITSFNGTTVTDWDQLRELIRGNADGKVRIGWERDGVPMFAYTNTTVELRPDSEEDQTLREVGFLGVTPFTEYVTGGPLYTVVQMGYTAELTAEAMLKLPQRVWGVARAIVGVQDRDPESPVSIVGGSRLAGETVSLEGFPLQEKAVFLLMLIAGFNFFIGAFNFIPLLPLDGGHIASALWEALRRGVARVRGRPDPGFVDAAKLLPVAYVMASAMLVMSVVLIVGDFVVPLHLVTS
jgi:membrane-associated protease RseP (regulator of RpoE activity)